MLLLQSTPRIGRGRLHHARRCTLAAYRRNISMDASIAVLGAGGRMGRIRCEAITSKGSKTKLAAVVDADAKALAELSRRYNVPGFRTLQEMLESNTGAALEAVWCCVRTDAHAKALQVAIAAGKHCAVEKPVAETEKEIREVYEAAERARVKLFCSFQRRADPLYARAAAQLRGKSLASIHTVFRDHPTPDTNFLAAAGGCIFSDLLVHDVDYVRYVTGDEIARVVATSTTFSPLLRRAGVADFASALLTTNKGTQVLMELSRHSKYGYDQRFEAFSSDGTRTSVRNVTAENSEVSYDLEEESETGRSSDMQQLVHSFPQRFAEAFRVEVRHFGAVVAAQRDRKGNSSNGSGCVGAHVRAVGEMDNAAANFDDALAAARVADAAKRSARDGGVPVEL